MENDIKEVCARYFYNSLNWPFQQTLLPKTLLTRMQKGHVWISQAQIKGKNIFKENQFNFLNVVHGQYWYINISS